MSLAAALLLLCGLLYDYIDMAPRSESARAQSPRRRTI